MTWCNGHFALACHISADAYNTSGPGIAPSSDRCAMLYIATSHRRFRWAINRLWKAPIDWSAGAVARVRVGSSRWSCSCIPCISAIPSNPSSLAAVPAVQIRSHPLHQRPKIEERRCYTNKSLWVSKYKQLSSEVCTSAAKPIRRLLNDEKTFWNVHRGIPVLSLINQSIVCQTNKNQDDSINM